MEGLTNNIQKLRKAAGITAASLAATLGINVTIMSFLESGQFCPEAAQVDKLAEALSAPPTDIYNKAALAFIYGKANEQQAPAARRPKLASSSNHKGQQQLKVWIDKDLLAAFDALLTARRYKSRAEWFNEGIRRVLFPSPPLDIIVNEEPPRMLKAAGEALGEAMENLKATEQAGRA